MRNAVGANMAFRREAFKLCKFSTIRPAGNQGDPIGIKRGLLGDDTLFSLEIPARTGRPILYNPSVVVRTRCIRTDCSRSTYGGGLSGKAMRKLLASVPTGAVIRSDCPLRPAYCGVCCLVCCEDLYGSCPIGPLVLGAGSP